jgi:hypothetical protein
MLCTLTNTPEQVPAFWIGRRLLPKLVKNRQYFEWNWNSDRFVSPDNPRVGGLQRDPEGAHSKLFGDGPRCFMGSVAHAGRDGELAERFLVDTAGILPAESAYQDLIFRGDLLLNVLQREASVGRQDGASDGDVKEFLAEPVHRPAGKFTHQSELVQLLLEKRSLIQGVGNVAWLAEAARRARDFDPAVRVDDAGPERDGREMPSPVARKLRMNRKPFCGVPDWSGCEQSTG